MLPEKMPTFPLVKNADGTIRIKGSRITLDTVIGQYKQGATAKQIQEDFPTLSLRDVYSVITYYLTYTNEVEAYLKNRKKDAQKIRMKIESDFNTQNFREIIRKRALKRQSDKDSSV